MLCIAYLQWVLYKVLVAECDVVYCLFFFVCFDLSSELMPGLFEIIGGYMVCLGLCYGRGFSTALRIISDFDLI